MLAKGSDWKRTGYNFLSNRIYNYCYYIFVSKECCKKCILTCLMKAKGL